MFNHATPRAHASALAFPFPAPLQRLESDSTHGVSVTGAAPAAAGTPGVGSSPRKLEAGNSSPFKCVGSEAGSY